MASTNNVKTVLDPSNFSDPSEAAGLIPNMIRESVPYDAFNNKTRFQARVLSRPVPMSHTDLQSYRRGHPEDPGTANFAEKRGYMFRARIIDDPSPHWTLPDPCDVGTGDEEVTAEIQSLIALHTKFIMMITDMGTIPKVGDLVAVELEKNVFGYNLQIGEAIKKIDKSRTSITVFGNNCGNCRGGVEPIRALAPTGAGAPNPPGSPRDGEVYDENPGGVRYEGDSGVRGASLVEADSMGSFDDVAFPIGSLPKEPPAIVAMREQGYIIMTDPVPGRLNPSGFDLWNIATINIIGIRKADPQVVNQFVDRIQTIWWAEGAWHVYSSHATTVPGSTYLTFKFENPEGAAIVEPGQHQGSHMRGSHPSGDGYYATPQQYGPLLIRRENDKSVYYGDDPTSPTMISKGDGINIHNSGGGTDHMKKINNYSAGCQVFKYKDDWQKHKDLWWAVGSTDEARAASDPRYEPGRKKAKESRSGKTGFGRLYRFNYTLLKEEEIVGGLPAADADALVRWGWSEEEAVETVSKWAPQGPRPWSADW